MHVLFQIRRNACLHGLASSYALDNASSFLFLQLNMKRMLWILLAWARRKSPFLIAELRDILLDSFPPLKEAGGFEFLRCKSNSRILEKFSDLAQSSPKVLADRSGTSTIYIRPIQKDIMRRRQEVVSYMIFLIHYSSMY